ncbi:MAG: EamA family transporter RarD, partial [Actinomycetes bacterium]
MSEKRFGRGLALGLGAYLIWGSFPLIIRPLAFASPFEVVVWRIVFGFLLAAAIITGMRGWESVRAVFKDRKSVIWILAAALFIYFNWQAYVFGVNTHQVVQTALGYFINPLVTILLAVVFLGERLNRLQWAAVTFGFIAVVLLTIDYGRPPWIALILASSFGLYGLAKNKLGGKVSALNSFALESGFLLPIALVQAFVVAQLNHGLKFGLVGFWGTAGLVLFGLLTAVPLIMFGSAAKHVPLRYIGFMQYLTPVLQFIIALNIFHEPMPLVRWVG